MALQLKNYELPDGTILEEAYIKVQNIYTAIVDYEHLKPSEIEGFELETTWIKKLESKANIFVFADELARKNSVAAIHWFPIEFDYQLSVYANIYEQAYKALKLIYTKTEDC
jgi:hypothetical protein